MARQCTTTIHDPKWSRFGMVSFYQRGKTNKQVTIETLVRTGRTASAASAFFKYHIHPHVLLVYCRMYGLPLRVTARGQMTTSFSSSA